MSLADCLTSITCFFIQTLIWNGSNGNQLQKLPNQGKETLDVLPFAANGNDFMAAIDEQKLTIYKWLNVWYCFWRHMQQGTLSCTCSCVWVTSITSWSNLYESTVKTGQEFFSQKTGSKESCMYQLTNNSGFIWGWTHHWVASFTTILLSNRTKHWNRSSNLHCIVMSYSSYCKFNKIDWRRNCSDFLELYTHW